MTRYAKTGADGATMLSALHAGLMQQCGIEPTDVDEKWLDTMVKRLFTELSRQLEQIETSAVPDGAKGEAARAANARTLATLERTLERLNKLEGQRRETREQKIRERHADARQKLERRLDRLAGGTTKAAVSTEADGR